jgi:hypothetical protein
MSPDDLREQIELNAVELIKNGLESGKFTEDRAQQLSQVVLDMVHPGMNFEQLYKAVSKLDDTAPELAPLVVPVMRDYEEHIAQQALSGVKNLIKQGQYDAASKLAQKVVDQDVKLVWEAKASPERIQEQGSGNADE